MKKKSNNNLLIFSGYHLPHLGGIERYTNNLSIEFQKLGWNVTIVSSNYKSLDSKEYINGILNYRIPIYNIFKSRYPIPKCNKEYKSIIKELDKEKYDAIIVNTRFHLTSLLGAKYGKKRNIPVFLIEHGSQHLTVDNKILDYLGAKYEHLLTKYVKKFVNYYFGVSKEACNWQKHFKINSNGVWYNSINNFYNIKSLKKPESKKTIITYAGRILKQKGIYELLESFVELDNNNIELHIAGDGNQLNILKEKYKNNKNIIFEGKLNFDNLVKLYEKTNIFVYVPLWPEGLPTSILEAGYMKCACIVTPYGGTKEIIENNYNGLIINNQKELTESLRLLISDKKLQKTLSNNLQKTVIENFYWENVSRKIEKDILEKIC